jgi:sialate O-acetylesterase
MRRALAASLAALWLAPAVAPAAATSPPRLLADLFQDHVVLQRDRPVEVWGRADPGVSVTVTLAGQSVTAAAAADGRWRVQLPAMPAGGPHRLSAHTDAGAEQQVQDVLLGDVWLCSGQSNMVLQVHRALDSRAEIEGASDSAIRMLTVPNETSLVPLDALPGAAAWQRTTPETVPDFSAACYFFARELRKVVKVPMGLINASWGGSAISSWMDEQALRELGGQEEGLALLAERRADPERAEARWGELWERWWRARSGDAPGAEPWNAPPGPQWKAVPAFTPWESWTGEGLDEFNGMVWYRTDARLTAAQAAQATTLHLAGIEDVDQTFVNGRPVGNTSAPGRAREYRLPAGSLRAGANSIVVNVLDTYGTGGVSGPPESRSLRFADGSVLRLDGAWLYRPSPVSMGLPPRTPWEATGGLTTIGNAMIAPLGHFGLRGVLWYQGESDTTQADSYAARLSALMRDWRRRFGDSLPFLVVQISAWGPASARPTDSAAAALREAQRRAVEADRNAALAVTIDIGERTDIHPANKQEVARRLARAARHLIYGEPGAPSGPRPVFATRTADGVVVRFRDVDASLVAYSAVGPIAFELCDTGATHCRFARAVIDGDTVRLDASGGPAAHVRYCWADSPVCNLYDASGLPAGPFELPVELP